jgi:hypothetical protein
MYFDFRQTEPLDQTYAPRFGRAVLGSLQNGTNLSKAAERRRVIIGLQLLPTGHSNIIYLPVSRVTHHLSAPVRWNGKGAWLHFENYRKRKWPRNVAADLFSREGFEIHGPATLETDRKTWHCIRVLGSRKSVEAKLSHLGCGKYALVPTSRRDTHQEVIAEHATDLLAIKVALWE